MELKAFVEALDDDAVQFGTRGMRWGVRKDRNAARAARRESNREFNRANAAKGNPKRAARDAKRAAKKAPEDVRVKTTPGRKVQTSGGKRQPAHEDAIKASISRRKASKSTTHSLSNKELQELVQRMQLEANYKRLLKDDSLSQFLLGEMESQSRSDLSAAVRGKS